MIRGNGGYGTDAGERARLRGEAAGLAALGIDGLVCGFADDGRLLLEDLIDIVPSVSDVRVTFHRAFDQLLDPREAIDRLKRLANVDRILTSGGNGSPEARCKRLAAYQERAGDRLTVIAGGGVDEATLLEIVRTQSVREVHVGRAARENLDPERPVSAERVAYIVEMLHRGG
jgi:copper homeostasis protein